MQKALSFLIFFVGSRVITVLSSQLCNWEYSDLKSEKSRSPSEQGRSLLCNGCYPKFSGYRCLMPRRARICSAIAQSTASSAGSKLSHASTSKDLLCNDCRIIDGEQHKRSHASTSKDLLCNSAHTQPAWRALQIDELRGTPILSGIRTHFNYPNFG